MGKAKAEVTSRVTTKGNRPGDREEEALKKMEATERNDMMFLF